MSGGNSKNELNLIILWGWLGPASSYQDNLDNSMFQNLWEQFVQACLCPSAQIKVPKGMGWVPLETLIVEELHWVAQSADLYRTVHLWDTLDCKSGPVLQHHSLSSKCLGILDE